MNEWMEETGDWDHSVAHNIFFLRIGIFMDTETLCLAEL